MAQALGQAFAQLFDRDWLVAGRFEVGNEPEVGHFNLSSVGAEYTVRFQNSTAVLVSCPSGAPSETPTSQRSGARDPGRRRQQGALRNGSDLDHHRQWLDTMPVDVYEIVLTFVNSGRPASDHRPSPATRSRP